MNTNLITYENKQTLNTNPSIPSVNKVESDNMNEIKSAINTGLLNLIYPVGTYYETSDTDFDPNTSWGGTWEVVENYNSRVAKVLFDNPTNNNVNITLSDSLANYEDALIIWKDNDNFIQSMEVNHPNGKDIDIVAGNPSGTTGIYLKASVYRLSGTSITRLTGSQLLITSNTGISASTGNYAYMTRIVGYNTLTVKKWQRTA